MNTKILIIILNWNGKKDTLECIASLQQMDSTPFFSLLIVDNGSTDNSIAEIRSYYPDISILQTGENLGYAGGNNAGILWGLGKPFEWFLLLNNDTWVAPDLLAQLLKAANQQPSAKILGAKIYCAHKPHRIEHLGGFWSPQAAEYCFPYAGKQDDDMSYSEMQEVDMVCGCALFMHRTVPETIGLLENRFFLLWEESDFCARAKKAGFGIWTAPQAKVWHKGSASFTGGKPHLEYFWWRNRLLWVSRNCTPSEKRTIYKSVLLKAIFRCIKFALLKSILSFFSSNQKRSQKALRYRAGAKGILDYFLGRFGNCPSKYTKKRF